MNLDRFITMPTFRPDGRLDALNKGNSEFDQMWVNFRQAVQEGKVKPKGGGASAPKQSMFKPAAKPTTSVSTPAVGNNVKAKRKSLLGSANS